MLQATRPRVGDLVTVQAIESDDYLLIMQPQAKVARVTDAGYYLHLEAVMPADKEFGPIPAARLQRGWQGANGRRL